MVRYEFNYNYWPMVAPCVHTGLEWIGIYGVGYMTGMGWGTRLEWAGGTGVESCRSMGHNCHVVYDVTSYDHDHDLTSTPGSPGAASS